MANEVQDKRVKVFLAFSHSDETLRAELEGHLSLLKRQGLISIWHDRRIGAGREWGEEIDEYLSSADVIVLLVSPSLLASDYCYGIEIRRALERHEAGAARLIPVILRPVDWQGAPFGKLQALPKDARPVTSWANRDEAFLDVARGIRAAVEQLAGIGARLAGMGVNHFSVLEDVHLDLCPGLNVLIGLNATGKSHVMKLAYSLLVSWASSLREGAGSDDLLTANLRKKLAGVFQPEEGQIGRLVRRSEEVAEVTLGLEHGGLRLRLWPDSRLDVQRLPSSNARQATAIFIPTHETLAMYEGFVAAYDNRELSFDETYYDLCVAMSANPLRSNHLGELSEVLDPLQEILGGRVRLRGNRFYVESEQERTEAHLLAEGLRKIAVVAHLIRNGSLARNSIVFWDEPEANLNPTLVTKVAVALHQLARAGMQIVTATHDYLLAHELSLMAEYPGDAPIENRFFSFYGDPPAGAVRVESASTLVEIEHNPLLEEYAAHHEREQVFFHQSLTADSETEP
ncbi:MAG: AAA family ATPase [bacterium]|nr:AAA family ATPase [bacterium]